MSVPSGHLCNGLPPLHPTPPPFMAIRHPMQQDFVPKYRQGLNLDSPWPHLRRKAQAALFGAFAFSGSSSGVSAMWFR